MTAQSKERRFPQESIKQFSDGQVIFLEGDDSREMYIVQEGEVIISKKFAHGEITLAVLQRGDFFGEMALLESLPRSATARSSGETKLLTIQTGGFLLKIRRDPTFAFEMLQHLSRRIRVTSEKLLKLIDQVDPSSKEILSVIQDAEFRLYRK